MLDLSIEPYETPDNMFRKSVKLKQHSMVCWR